MFNILSVNRVPSLAGNSAVLLTAALDATALGVMYEAVGSALAIYEKIVEDANTREDEEEFWASKIMDAEDLLEAIKNSLEALDALNICAGCGQKKSEHNHDVLNQDAVDEVLSDDNLAQVIDLFSKSDKGGEA